MIILTNSLIHFLQGWENALFELSSERCSPRARWGQRTAPPCCHVRARWVPCRPRSVRWSPSHGCRSWNTSAGPTRWTPADPEGTGQRVLVLGNESRQSRRGREGGGKGKGGREKVEGGRGMGEGGRGKGEGEKWKGEGERGKGEGGTGKVEFRGNPSQGPA